MGHINIIHIYIYTYRLLLLDTAIFEATIGEFGSRLATCLTFWYRSIHTLMGWTLCSHDLTCECAAYSSIGEDTPCFLWSERLPQVSKLWFEMNVAFRQMEGEYQSDMRRDQDVLHHIWPGWTSICQLLCYWKGCQCLTHMSVFVRAKCSLRPWKISQIMGGAAKIFGSRSGWHGHLRGIPGIPIWRHTHIGFFSINGGTPK